MGYVTDKARLAANRAEALRYQAVQAEVERRIDMLEPHIPYLSRRLQKDVERQLLKGPVPFAVVVFSSDYNGRIRDLRDYETWRAFVFKRKDCHRAYMNSEDNREKVSHDVEEFLVKRLQSHEDRVSAITLDWFASGPSNVHQTHFMRVHFSPALT